MLAKIEGEVRGIKELEKEGKKTGKYMIAFEQKTGGLPVGLFIITKKNTRKVGEQLTINVNIDAGIGKDKNPRLWINEV